MDSKQEKFSEYFLKSIASSGFSAVFTLIVGATMLVYFNFVSSQSDRSEAQKEFLLLEAEKFSQVLLAHERYKGCICGERECDDQESEIIEQDLVSAIDSFRSEEFLSRVRAAHVELNEGYFLNRSELLQAASPRNFNCSAAFDNLNGNATDYLQSLAVGVFQ